MGLEIDSQHREHPIDRTVTCLAVRTYALYSAVRAAGTNGALCIPLLVRATRTSLAIRLHPAMRATRTSLAFRLHLAVRATHTNIAS